VRAGRPAEGRRALARAGARDARDRKHPLHSRVVLAIARTSRAVSPARAVRGS